MAGILKAVSGKVASGALKTGVKAARIGAGIALAVPAGVVGAHLSSSGLGQIGGDIGDAYRFISGHKKRKKKAKAASKPQKPPKHQNGTNPTGMREKGVLEALRDVSMGIAAATMSIRMVEAKVDTGNKIAKDILDQLEWMSADPNAKLAQKAAQNQQAQQSLAQQQQVVKEQKTGNWLSKMLGGLFGLGGSLAGWLKGLFDGPKSLIAAGLTRALAAVLGGTALVKAFTSSIKDGFKNLLGKGSDFLTDVAKGIRERFTKAIDAIGDSMKSLQTKVSEFVDNVRTKLTPPEPPKPKPSVPTVDGNYDAKTQRWKDAWYDPDTGKMVKAGTPGAVQKPLSDGPWTPKKVDNIQEVLDEAKASGKVVEPKNQFLDRRRMTKAQRRQAAIAHKAEQEAIAKLDADAKKLADAATLEEEARLGKLDAEGYKAVKPKASLANAAKRGLSKAANGAGAAANVGSATLLADELFKAAFGWSPLEEGEKAIWEKAGVDVKKVQGHENSSGSILGDARDLAGRTASHGAGMTQDDVNNVKKSQDALRDALGIKSFMEEYVDPLFNWLPKKKDMADKVAKASEKTELEKAARANQPPVVVTPPTPAPSLPSMAMPPQAHKPGVGSARSDSRSVFETSLFGFNKELTPGN